MKGSLFNENFRYESAFFNKKIQNQNLCLFFPQKYFNAFTSQAEITLKKKILSHASILQFFFSGQVPFWPLKKKNKFLKKPKEFCHYLLNFTIHKKINL